MKTATIHSYFLTALGVSTVTMPAGAKVLSVMPSAKGIRLSAIHEETEATTGTVRHFYVTRTGVPMPLSAMTTGTFLHSFRGGVHVLEVTAAAAADISDLYPNLDTVLGDLGE
jgi:hypothetical protein